MEDNPVAMEGERKPLRADAERNRRRLIDAATAIFCERGLEVGVGEISDKAGVGRGTLFRNFPSKEHLIAAIVVERIHQMVDRGRAQLDAEDAGEALFGLLDESVGLQQTDRALFDALDDNWLTNDEIHAAHVEMMGVLDALVARAQAAGAVREDVGAVDVMMMVKGVCEATRSFQHVDPAIGGRQLDLVRAALSPSPGCRPLRGQPPALEDLDPAAIPGTTAERQPAERATG
jgi:AcrR family transcriptional regulator